MQPERFKYDHPAKVGRVLMGLGPLYLSYKPDSFPFEWLQKTEEFEVRCRDATGEEVIFPVSPELLDAIHKSKELQHEPLPSDWGFSGFMTFAVHEVLHNVPFTKAEEFYGPILSKLRTVVIESYPRILGCQYVPLRQDHWSCIMRDHSSPFDPNQGEGLKDYFLRSEMLAVTAIFVRQMYEMIWLPEKDRHGAKLRYKEGLLTVTVVTFIRAKVRVVQATLNPSEPYPVLTVTLRAIYNLGEKNYDKEVAFDVLKWILSPPDAAEKVAVRGKK